MSHTPARSEEAPSQPGPLRIGYLFVGDKSHEFEALERGEVPSHRVFAAKELRQLGHAVLYVRRTRRRPRWVPVAIHWRLVQAGWVLRHQARLDVLLASHEAAAAPALLLRRLRLLRRPMVVMTVAVPALCRQSTVSARLQRWALGAAEVVTVFASSQISDVSRCLCVPVSRVRFLPLGVDTDFFRPDSQYRRDGSVLAVGTNLGKDFPTLIRALPEGVACTVVTDEANRRACADHLAGKEVTFLADLPIRRLRRMYAQAGVVVLPLRDVDFSSGQTVLLENLAMGSPMIVTDVPAVRDYVVGSPVSLVPAGDVAELRRAITASLGGLTATPAKPESRGPALAGFSALDMAQALEALLEEVAGSSLRRSRP